MNNFACGAIATGISHGQDLRDCDCGDTGADVWARYRFDSGRAFLPDVLSLTHELDFISSNERHVLSQIQGRTYANLSALFAQLKSHEPCNPVAHSGAAVTPSSAGNYGPASREIELLRRVDEMIAQQMPRGYRFGAGAEKFTRSARAGSAWSRSALGYHIDLSAQVHYKLSSRRAEEMAPLFKEFIRDHWLAESRCAISDGIEWARLDTILTKGARDHAVHDLVGIFQALDECLQCQAESDIDYFLRISGRAFGASRRERLNSTTLAAYRWQHIAIGFNSRRFMNTLTGFVSERQFRGLCELFGKVSHRRTLH